MKKMEDVNLYKSDAKLAARLGISGPMVEEESPFKKVPISSDADSNVFNRTQVGESFDYAMLGRNSIDVTTSEGSVQNLDISQTLQSPKMMINSNKP